MKVGVINYGVGNLGSVLRAFEDLDATPIIVDRPQDLHLADSLVLPGVGNFADCARILERVGWMAALREEVIGCKRPLLGICLGMQMLADNSTEGAPLGETVAGLGFIPGNVESLHNLGCNLRVPHVGWNNIRKTNSEEHFLKDIPDGTDFYFVHSYAFKAHNCADVVATCEYGVTITAVVRRGHIWGTQFHPEKSSRAGFRLLNTFLKAPVC
jgi:glutamine amidotransferase